MKTAIRLMPVYDKRGWVLAECSVCGRVNYVEPHGTTARCCMPEFTEHNSIPFADRDTSGTVVVTVARRVRRSA